MKTNFTKRLLGAWRQALMACVLFSAIGISDAAAQSCYTCSSGSNTTLDPATCTAVVGVLSFMKVPCADVTYSITVQGVTSASTTSVVISAPGPYTYSISGVHKTTGATNLCWGTFNVEDKSGPICTVGIPTSSTDTLGTRIIECVNEDNWKDSLDVLTIVNFKDCSGPVASVYFVDESVSGCGIVNPDTLGVPNDGSFVIPTGASICAVNKRTWFAVDADGKVSNDTCVQFVFSLRSTATPQIINTVKVDCAADQSTLAAAIAPKIPVITTAILTDSISLTNGKKVCKYIATLNEGVKLPTCGKGYKQINTWTVIDWCLGMIVANEQQLVIVEDTTDPTTSVAGTITFAADPFDCSGVITVAPATGTDDCSPNALTWTTSISSTGGSGHTGGNDVSTVLNTNGGSLANVPIGATVTVSWIASDECGNQSVARTKTFTGTIDNRGPVAICNDELNVSLVAANNTQQARVYAEDLDDTSRDNCGITKKEVSLDGITYSDYVTLGCSNLGSVTVYLRVSDAAKNSNVCWTQITVEDKSVPVVTAPADKAINCLDEIPAVETPTIVAQGCVAPSIVYNGESNVGIACGNDIITRMWTVTPPSTGAHAPAAAYTIKQMITVSPAPASWIANFPPDDLTLTCDGMNTIPAQLKLEDILVDKSCNDWRLNVEDKDYSAGGAVCRKVVRTYTLINWCTVVNPGKPAAIVTKRTVNQADVGAVPGGTENLQTYGIFSYTQVFKISDTEVPTANIAATPSCDNTATTCDGGIVTVAVTNAMDNCGSATITIINIKGTGVDRNDATPADGAATFTGLPAGNYTVSATIVDACNNQRVVTTPATVIGDCKKPTIINTVVVTKHMPETDPRMVQVWLSDVLVSWSDNCVTPGEYMFAIENVRTAGTTFPTAGVTTDPKGKVAALFQCPEDFNGGSVRVWMKDKAGNTQFVDSPVSIQGDCSAGVAAAIAGKITNEGGEDITQVMVKFENSGQSLFEQLFSGNFNYSVPMHTDLTITPEKDLGYANGVSTGDLVKLQRHILGISSLTSAYQMIAADVNSDEKVNTKDMLHISRLILGLYDKLPNSASWKFVSKDHQFSNPTSPWGFPQAMNYADLASDIQADFVGIKIGDLTGNASPSNLIGDDNTYVGEMTVALDETTLIPGESTVVEFKAADFTDFAGYQFTISLGDHVKLSAVTPGVLPNMSEESNFGLNRLSEGTITTSWSNANGVTLEDGAVLFSLTIESTETVNLSEVISINSKQTAAEAYNNDLDVHTVGVQFTRAEATVFKLFQNQPNPFDGETVIGFNMPEAGVASLKVMNVAGQILTSQSAEFVRGYNQISLNKSELNATGVLYYQIETENHSATRKMVILE